LNKDHPRRRVRQRQHHRYQGEPQEVRGRGSSRQKAKLNIEALQATAQPGGINEYIDLGAPGASLNWDALYGSSPDDRVVFVHANGCDLQLDFSANREARSTLVVHCGNPTIGARNSRGSSQFWTIRAVPISAGEIQVQERGSQRQGLRPRREYRGERRNIPGQSAAGERPSKRRRGSTRAGLLHHTAPELAGAVQVRF
jgi:hypothetical protein